MKVLSEELIPVDRQVAFQKLMRDTRAARGYANQAAAEAATEEFYGEGKGVSQSFISDIENGPRDRIQLFPFFRYIHFLGFTMSEAMQVLGLEKTSDVEDNDRLVRLKGALHAVAALPPERRKAVEDAILALVQGYK